MSADTLAGKPPIKDSSTFISHSLEKLYDRSIDWLLYAGPRIIFAIIALIAGFWIIRIIRRKFEKIMTRRDVHSSLRPFFTSLVFTALNVALIFLIMQILGIRLTIFAAVIAAFGAAAGLALSGTLQNFASGVLILVLKPFKVGDNINAQGVEGSVSSIQIFFTVITTFDNRTVIMPNSKLSNEVITNITSKGIRRLDIELQFKHAMDFDKVRAILEKAFTDMQEVDNDPHPRIGVSAMSMDNYTVISNVWVKAHGFEDTRLVVFEKVMKALHEAGIYVEAH